MLKVKVEPVEPTLYGKVSLPNNPLTIAGYQVFCNDDERHEEKVVEEEEDHLSSGGDGEIEGTDRMMTDCCRENDLLGGDLGSDGGVKDDDDIHVRGYVENDVMVDNNIVEEQVVEDSMVLVSPVTHETSPDGIQAPYMETGPTEVLVIEEGAELMVENNHGIGYSHMIMDEENGQYLITAEVGEPPETLITEGDNHHIVDNNDIQFSQPEHVMVERINYEIPLIEESDATQYYLQEDQPINTTTEQGIDVEQNNFIVEPLETSLQQTVAAKSEKIVKKKIRVPEPVQKKKAAKRKSEDKNSESIVNQPESATNKSRKRRKSQPTEAMISQQVTTPKQDQIPLVATQSTRVSPIQANHPTLSLLLSKKGPMEVVGLVSEPAKPTLIKKQLFASAVVGGMDLRTPKLTPKRTPAKVKSVTAPLQPSPIQPEALLPQVVTEINEAEEMIIRVPHQESDLKPTPKKATLKIPKSPIKVKHSKNNNNKQVSKPLLALLPSVPEVTPLSTCTVMNFKNPPAVIKMTMQCAEAVHKGSVLRNKSAITQPTISLINPITVAVADNLAISSLPPANSGSVLTVPKPMRRLQVGQAATSKTVPSIGSQPVIAVPIMSTHAPPVASPLSVTVAPTSPTYVSTYTTVTTDHDPLVSPIQKKHQTVTTTLQARLAAKPKCAPNGSETLADRYMKEWKPTGRFQCKLCLYSCVTHNFLFRHWVLNHCSLRPYMCGHCGFQSATRDGVTRHQTAKHRGLTRRIFIDNERQEELWNKFDEMFQGSGFVTELERQAQATYTLAHVSKAQHLQDAGQFSHTLSNKAAGTLEREVEVVASTILKVPKRENVPGKFREVILSSSDDQDLGSSQESGDEEGEEESVIRGYYMEPHAGIDPKSQIILHHTPPREVPLTISAISMRAAPDICQPNFQDDETEVLENECPPDLPVLEQDGPDIADQLYQQYVTSGPAMVHTPVLAAQDSVNSTELLAVASKEKNTAGQVGSATVTTQASLEGESHQESIRGEKRD